MIVRWFPATLEHFKVNFWFQKLQKHSLLKSNKKFPCPFIVSIYLDQKLKCSKTEPLLSGYSSHARSSNAWYLLTDDTVRTGWQVLLSAPLLSSPLQTISWLGGQHRVSYRSSIQVRGGQVTWAGGDTGAQSLWAGNVEIGTIDKLSVGSNRHTRHFISS